jgi:four helix bundle protein
MDNNDLLKRTKKIALNTIAFVQGLEKNKASYTLGNQLFRSATSIGANYRAANRAKSKADFAYKIKIVEEECDETEYWLELFIESGIAENNASTALLSEARQLTAIFSSISIKLKSK